MATCGWHRVKNKRQQVEKTCKGCIFPVMLTCCFYICAIQPLSLPFLPSPCLTSLKKKKILKSKLGFILVLKMPPFSLNSNR